MSLNAAFVLVALWLLGIGIVSVYFEVESIHCGDRVQDLLQEEAFRLDEMRRWEMRYNKMLSPDLLYRALPEEFYQYEEPTPTIPREVSSELQTETSTVTESLTRRVGVSSGPRV